MFIYFNISSHLWILYVFLLNGFLLTHLLWTFSTDYKTLVESFEARLLSGFFLSILLNGVSLVTLEKLGFDFFWMKYILPTISLLLCLLLAWVMNKKNIALRSVVPEFGRLRFLLYSFVFVVLFYNGGLVDQLADSWWHMALANKIADLSSFDVNSHLSGAQGRYYPPLWHGNLAMLKKVSGVSLPVLWNSFTAWGGSFKVMGFYLLALGLCRDKSVALLSAFLFVVLPGLGDSYFRVSAWPSHISYIAWFCLFFVTFSFFDKCNIPVVSSENGTVKCFLDRYLKLLKENRVSLACIVVLSLIVFFSHQAELLWFVCGIMFYAIFLSCYQLVTEPMRRVAEPAERLLRVYLLSCLAGVIVVTVKTYFTTMFIADEFSDTHLVFLLLFINVGILMYLLLENTLLGNMYDEKVAKILLFIMLSLVFLSIDLKQLLSLFYPEYGYPIPRYYEAPLHATGWLKGQLVLPGWHMQLRGGLLYSGVLAIVVSVWMVFVKPNRGTLFLSANVVIPFLFLISPYHYQWLSDVSGYLSSWRIALLIFHPIVLASFVLYLWEIVNSTRTKCI